MIAEAETERGRITFDGCYGARWIDDFPSWGASRCRQMGRHLSDGGLPTICQEAAILLRTTPLSQRAVLAVVVIYFPETPHQTRDNTGSPRRLCLKCPCGKAIEPAKRPARGTAKSGSGETADHRSQRGQDRHAWRVRITKDLRFATCAACRFTRWPGTPGL